MWIVGDSDEKFPFPIIDDSNRELAYKLEMIDKNEIDNTGQPLTARAVFIIDNNRKFRLSLLYPATTGRNFTYVDSTYIRYSLNVQILLYF